MFPDRLWPYYDPDQDKMVTKVDWMNQDTNTFQLSSLNIIVFLQNIIC